MSKKITLTIGERLAALKIFDAFKGSITELSTILDDVKKVVISPEEWEKAKRVVTKTDTGEQWKWDEDSKETFREIELQSESIGYLTKSIKEKSDKNEITIADLALVNLNKKLL